MTGTSTVEAPFASASRVADEILFPAAQEVDRAERVPDGHLRALADAGLFGVVGPASAGGLELGPREFWRIAAALGGGCGATFFVWVQHHMTVQILRTSDNSSLVEELLGPLCAGTAIAGVAFAHLRRSGPPAIEATRVDGGWRFDGFSPWTTSWGIADRFTIAAETDDRHVVWGVLDADAAGIEAIPLALPVFGATGTMMLRLDECVVPDRRVGLIQPVGEWRAADRLRSAAGTPATLGIAQRCVRLLDDLDDAQAAEAAARLAVECDERAAAFDELPVALANGAATVADGARHRAACIALAQRSATALLAAVGGRGMDLAHPAQRLAREAAFFVIQAQTADGRAATLSSI